MARWSLLKAHCLNVPGNEWEREEINRDTGKKVRKRFSVPLFLDPQNPADWNYPSDEAIIVCHENKGMPKDIVFTGTPTLDMFPLDDEARVLSEQVKKSVHPIEGLSAQVGEDFGAQLMQKLEGMIDAIVQGKGKPQIENQSVGVSKEEFDSLKDQFAQLIQQNAALQAQLSEMTASRAERRV